LLLLAAFEHGKLIGVAPFMITRKWVPVPSLVIRFIGGPGFSSDFCALIFAPGREDVSKSIGRWVAEHPRLWNEVDLVNVLEGSPGLATLMLELGKDFKPTLRFLYDAPTIRLSGTEADREVVNKKSLKRHFNWFKNQGTLAFEHVNDADRIKAHLDTFFEQHISRRAISEAPSLFLDPQQKVFYRKLVDELLPLGWLRFFTVTLDGKPIAYHFGFEFLSRYYWYKPTFDIQYVKKSHGEVLLKALIEDSIARKLKEFDFTAGSEGFKYRFANHTRKLYRLHAFRSLPQYTAFQAFQAALKLKRGLNRLRPDRKRPSSPSQSPDVEPAPAVPESSRDSA
jgi:CelD/BcsL family acetyltransferase involved in cellulose biosynthesis